MPALHGVVLFLQDSRNILEQAGNFRRFAQDNNSPCRTIMTNLCSGNGVTAAGDVRVTQAAMQRGKSGWWKGDTSSNAARQVWVMKVWHKQQSSKASVGDERVTQGAMQRGKSGCWVDLLMPCLSTIISACFVLQCVAKLLCIKLAPAKIFYGLLFTCLYKYLSNSSRLDRVAHHWYTLCAVLRHE